MNEIAEFLERERSYQMQIKFLRQEKDALKAERDMFRSQAIMRANKILLLEKQLEQSYE